MNQYVFEEERPVVDTKCGKIRGIAYGGVNIFMGIDYAKAKRFQMPEEIQPPLRSKQKMGKSCGKKEFTRSAGKDNA